MLNRNDRCHCGSGLKYKKCCLESDESKSDPYYIIEHASEHPLVQCLNRKDWDKDGLATILIIRRHSETGKFLLCMFLVDTLCLGVKDVFFNADSEEDKLARLIDHYPWEFIDVDYEQCRGLILGAVDFARKFGFEPHPEWEIAKGFIESDKPYTKNYSFGRKGKPFYVEGPHDDVDSIVKTLDKLDPRQTSLYE